MPIHRFFLPKISNISNFVKECSDCVLKKLVCVNKNHEHKWVRRIAFKKTLVSLSHLLGVSLLFILPEMVISVISNEGPRHLTTVVYGKALVYVAVFYINFYVIVPFCMRHPHPKLRFAGCNLLLAIFAMGMLAFLWHWGHSEPSHPGAGPLPPPPPPHGYGPKAPDSRVEWVMIWRDSLVLLLTIALAVAIKLTGKWEESERMRHEAKSIQQQNELSRLKAQLNPHFLFNTLNTIYALIDISPDKARDAVHELSNMLRYALYECHNTVRLQDELRFAESYLNIASLRLPSPACLNVVTEAGECGELQMAPMLFVNLIENSLKHCYLSSPNDHIDVRITAANGVVTCVCSNPYLKTTPPNTNGLGIKNLKRRLEILYGPRSQMTIDKTDTRYTVTLQVDISSPPEYSDLTSYSNISLLPKQMNS